MEDQEILDRLVELAEEAGLDVRVLAAGSGPVAELPPRSGVVRVRGKVWVILCDADPLDDRIRVLGEALQEYAGELLEGRYLPPALRDRLVRS